jgi:hypothetical protein
MEGHQHANSLSFCLHCKDIYVCGGCSILFHRPHNREDHSEYVIMKKPSKIIQLISTQRDFIATKLRNLRDLKLHSKAFLEPLL